MIRSVHGKIRLKQADWVLVETASGVGYRVFTNAAGTQLPIGEEVTFYTHLVVRETQLSLFGFVRLEGVDLFESLLKVSGVGPKSALAIMNLGDLDDITQAIRLGNSAYIASAVGIGRKTSEKVVLELKDKIVVLSGSGRGNAAIGQYEELRQALLELGYNELQIGPVLSEIDPDLAIEQQIRLALSKL